MGCGIIKSLRHTKNANKESGRSQEGDNRRDRFSLYTVREELSEMEQSHLPSKRQSVLNPLDPVLNN